MTAKHILMAAVSLSFLAMPVIPANALTPASEDGWAHFSECLGVMFSDPATHAAECSPSNNPQDLKSLTGPVTYTPCQLDLESSLPYGASYKVAAISCDDEEEPPVDDELDVIPLG